MHRYRTHTCGALRESDIGKDARLAGWCHRIRDHGGVLFIDLRDHYGVTQVVADPDSPAFKDAEKLRAEWVVRIDGLVRNRPAGTENPDLPTGMVEIFVKQIEVLGAAAELPVPVFGEQEYPEELRLKYRFLDLRREGLHRNIMRRGAITHAAVERDGLRLRRAGERKQEEGTEQGQSLKLEKDSGVSAISLRSKAIVACRSSRLAPVTRTVSPWIAS